MAEQQAVTILDGGLGHLLKRRRVHTSAAGTEWGGSFVTPALANAEAPAAVRQVVHEDYLAAGVDVITVNNFSVTPWSLGRVGREGDFVALTQAAAHLARSAVHAWQASIGAEQPLQPQPQQQQQRHPLVAGSLGPLGESYATGGGPASIEAAASIYSQMAAALAPHVDLLLIETMASGDEACAAAAAAAASGLPFWVALTLEDSEAGLLRSGEPLGAVAARLADFASGGMQAVLLNCSAPQAISAALPRLRTALPDSIRIGAYANGFQRTTSEWLADCGASPPPQLHRDPGDYQDGIIMPAAYARFARAWVDAGATIIGGCCGVGPEHIRALRRAAVAPRHDSAGSGGRCVSPMRIQSS